MSLSTINSAFSKTSNNNTRLSPHSRTVSAPPETDGEPATATISDIDPTSDAALSLSSSFPSFASFDSKDQRAYEHDRQRSKRSEEYLRLREAKAFKRGSTMLSKIIGPDSLSSPSSLLRGKRIPGTAESVSEAAAAAATWDDDWEGVRSPSRILSTPKSPAETIGVATTTTIHRIPIPEVKLADLITPGSIRKSRRGIHKDPEFEVIPPIRSVIVLDEFAFMHDTPPPRDLEQEWEHVHHSDDDSEESYCPSSLSRKIHVPPSYANVVSGGL
ncbi:hypothetical protein D9757_006932 [Collybiopsis confluens]|uniref:Uncharacterized protein n=1 Tax=Collybiopsis confluens TaxID=2823264 RepID=A0A8H5M7W7_9AGAR|nr:hypothetical protein D9757_006932 [Collybiopsis confluens]